MERCAEEYYLVTRKVRDFREYSPIAANVKVTSSAQRSINGHYFEESRDENE